MAPVSAVVRSALAALLFVSPPAAATPLEPSADAVRRNAFDIFNAVHSAMRQWGSSLNHNGMSLFLATVPEGQLFYHGGRDAGRPQGFEWLAFELEHAQMFGTSWSGRGGFGLPGKGGDEDDADDADQSVWDWHVQERQRGQLHTRPLEEEAQKIIGDGGDGRPLARGYFQTYRASRPLNLLYIDGMAAGKTSYGCLDTQDLLLLDRDPATRNGTWWSGQGGELDRAQGLCDLARDWAWDSTAEDGSGQIDGFVRTEAGFEIIYCDFRAGRGLDLVSARASPFVNETGGLPVFSQFEFLRGVAQRYHGQPAGRIRVDWSSMVSAFFYDVNLTNPDAARPELPRLAGVPRDDLRRIRSRFQAVVAARHVGPGRPLQDKPVVDWQGIVDTVVTRFAGRLSQLANDTSAPLSATASDVVPLLVFPYMDYADARETDAVRLDRCTNHYLAGALATKDTWTPEDYSIHAAVAEVTRTICRALFDMRAVLVEAADDDDDDDDDTDGTLRRIVAELMGTLRWTTWRECAPCAQPDEQCLIAMFPWGTPDDHFSPRCKNKEQTDVRMRNNYWMMGR